MTSSSVSPSGMSSELVTTARSCFAGAHREAWTSTANEGDNEWCRVGQCLDPSATSRTQRTVLRVSDCPRVVRYQSSAPRKGGSSWVMNHECTFANWLFGVVSKRRPCAVQVHSTIHYALHEAFPRFHRRSVVRYVPGANNEILAPRSRQEARS